MNAGEAVVTVGGTVICGVFGVGFDFVKGVAHGVGVGVGIAAFTAVMTSAILRERERQRREGDYY